MCRNTTRHGKGYHTLKQPIHGEKACKEGGQGSKNKVAFKLTSKGNVEKSILHQRKFGKAPHATEIQEDYKEERAQCSWSPNSINSSAGERQ